MTLVHNGLLHLQFELEQDSPNYFRVAREAYRILYSSMIEALKGSANLAITGRPSGDRQVRYRLGNEPWQEIHKVSIEGCEKAWRFSDPSACDPPELSTDQEQNNKDDYLVGFYDALAMIQEDCYMHRYVMSRSVQITDEEMRVLELLHENIRNSFEHFVPRTLISPIIYLIETSLQCINISTDLIFESGNVMIIDEELRNDSERLLQACNETLYQTLNTQRELQMDDNG